MKLGELDAHVSASLLVIRLKCDSTNIAAVSLQKADRGKSVEVSGTGRNNFPACSEVHRRISRAPGRLTRRDDVAVASEASVGEMVSVKAAFPRFVPK